MPMLIRSLLFMLCVFIPSFAVSESPFPSSAAKIISIENEPQFLPVNDAFSVIVTSDKNLLTLDWQIAEDYYLYKSQFKFSSNDFTVGYAALPAGEVINDPYIGNTEIYARSFSMQLPIEAVKKSSDAHLTITFQGCAKAGFCYPPETITVPVNLDTTAITLNPSSAHASVWLYLLFALIGGLILNLMPCVFPVLSIKVLSFAKHSENPRHLKLHGWVYTAGVILSFIAIAALLMYLRAAGETIGWGFQLQNSIFISLLIILFFFMSLHLFGFFSIDVLFSRLSNHSHSLAQGHHLKASFFTGLLSVIVATPCTVPFMAPAIGFALTQSTFVALSVFAMLGLGLALPFLILTYCPNLIARLPKPGVWMEHLKQLLAFPLLLTAMWLLWVLGHQTNINHVITVGTLCVALTFVIWLWQLHYKKIVLSLLMISALVYSLSFFTQQKKIDEPFTQLRFNELRTAGEPIFINMTADWCITCLINEKVALSTESVKNAFIAHKIHYLKGDWTNQNPEITAFLKTFNRSGIPLYVFYPPGNDSKPVVLPQLLTPTIVVDAISSNKNK